MVGGKSEFVTSSSGISRMLRLALVAELEAAADIEAAAPDVAVGVEAVEANLRLSRLFAFI